MLAHGQVVAVDQPLITPLDRQVQQAPVPRAHAGVPRDLDDQVDGL
jgi:hypothetical protein